MLAEVATLATAHGYGPVTLAENTLDMGDWYHVKAGVFVIGTGKTWTACLTEAREYLCS